MSQDQNATYDRTVATKIDEAARIERRIRQTLAASVLAPWIASFFFGQPGLLLAGIISTVVCYRVLFSQQAATHVQGKQSIRTVVCLAACFLSILIGAPPYLDISLLRLVLAIPFLIVSYVTRPTIAIDVPEEVQLEVRSLRALNRIDARPASTENSQDLAKDIQTLDWRALSPDAISHEIMLDVAHRCIETAECVHGDNDSPLPKWISKLAARHGLPVSTHAAAIIALQSAAELCRHVAEESDDPSLSGAATDTLDKICSLEPKFEASLSQDVHALVNVYVPRRIRGIVAFVGWDNWEGRLLLAYGAFVVLWLPCLALGIILGFVRPHCLITIPFAVIAFGILGSLIDGFPKFLQVPTVVCVIIGCLYGSGVVFIEDYWRGKDGVEEVMFGEGGGSMLEGLLVSPMVGAMTVPIAFLVIIFVLLSPFGILYGIKEFFTGQEEKAEQLRRQRMARRMGMTPEEEALEDAREQAANWERFNHHQGP